MPTPRGLGIALVPVVLLSWLLLALVFPETPKEIWWVCAGAALLACISWIDDVKGLPVTPRLLAQIVVVVAGVHFFGGPLLLQSAGVPPLASRLVTVALWLGLINQVNFTDGIDGHLGAMLATVGAGLFTISLFTHSLGTLGPFGLTLATAAIGFLVWNWHPAKGFMGDVGSVPLGFIVGWMLLRTASLGQWAPALILPLFYFADTAVTYARRIAHGTHFWKPHREYLYQRAALRIGHARVVTVVALCNVLLVGPAVVAARGAPWLALLLAVVPVASAYAYLTRLAGPVEIRAETGRTLA